MDVDGAANNCVVPRRAMKIRSELGERGEGRRIHGLGWSGGWGGGEDGRISG